MNNIDEKDETITGSLGLEDELFDKVKEVISGEILTNLLSSVIKKENKKDVSVGSLSKKTSEDLKLEKYNEGVLVGYLIAKVIQRYLDLSQKMADSVTEQFYGDGKTSINSKKIDFEEFIK